MMINNIVEIKDFLITFLLENKIILLILVSGLALILSSIFFNKKVTLKKRKDSVKHIKILATFCKYIENVKFIKSKRDELSINLALITHKNTKTNKIYADNIISLFIAFMLFTIVGTTIFIKNIILKLLLPILFIVVIPLIFDRVIERKRMKAKSDFKEVISIYTSKYSYCLNIIKAFERSIKDIPSSHKYEFTRLISSFKARGDYIKALNEYALRINDNFCYAFVEIIKASYFDNTQTINALIELENAISIDKKNELNRINKTGQNKMQIYFWMICIVVFGLLEYKILGSFAINFFTNTFSGQALMLVVIVAVMLVFITMHIVDRI